MVFLVGFQRELANLDGKTLLFLILSGLATGASWLCYFKALQLGDINKVVPIDKSSTVLTILLAFLFLNESVSVPKLIGVVLIAAGTLLMIEKKSGTGSGEIGLRWLWYALGSAVFARLTSILGKIGISGVESNLGTAIRTIVILVMSWITLQVTLGKFLAENSYQVWDDHTIHNVDEAVKAQIMTLRQKLSVAGNEYIKNVWGIGYRFHSEPNDE